MSSSRILCSTPLSGCPSNPDRVVGTPDRDNRIGMEMLEAILGGNRPHVPRVAALVPGFAVVGSALGVGGLLAVDPRLAALAALGVFVAAVAVVLPAAALPS